MPLPKLASYLFTGTHAPYTHGCQLLYPSTFSLCNTSLLASGHISLVEERGKKRSQSQFLSLPLSFWWSSFKPPGSNPKTGKHRFPKANKGMNKCDNSHSLLGSLDFQISGMKTTAGLGKVYPVYWYEGCILYGAAESTGGVHARSKPSTHTCVHWPVYRQAGWTAGRLTCLSHNNEVLENGLYQKSILLKSSLQVWATEWLLPRHAASSTCDESWFLVGNAVCPAGFLLFQFTIIVHSHGSQLRSVSLAGRTGSHTLLPVRWSLVNGSSDLKKVSVQ